MNTLPKSVTKQNSLLLSAAAFPEKGGWTVDQQFMLQMGSTILLAHGLGNPVADAVTTANFPADGTYNIYVRTRDWTAGWSKGDSAGRFTLAIDGKQLDTQLGNEKSEWHWQSAGTITLNAGEHTVALRDLTGFDGRCDSILFTLTNFRPDESLETLAALRKKLLGQPAKPEYKGSYDLVVVGGGMSGMCAAIAAARLGSRVALIQDRYVMGGNNSSEVRVGLGGRINIGMYPSLGYLLNELGPANKGNARTADNYEDDKKMNVVLAEKRITLFTGYKVTEVEKSADDMLKGVIATEVTTYERIRIRGRLFSDCTGDATLGVLAGAEWRMGREAKSEYGEPSAPEKADGMTMGASLQWYCVENDQPAPFKDINWGLEINEQTVQKVRRGQWYWEAGMMDDQIEEAEKIRDWGMYVAYSNWNYLKNHFSQRDEYTNSSLGWVSCVAGKRESRRIMGEFVLREQDLKEFKIYPDASASTSWYVDIHYPDPENSKHFPGREWLSVGHLDPIPFYPIPYRCFYSKDIRNMFMAGRDISVTHIALGTVRVMRTCAMMGEVVGMAASICRKRKALPRDIYTTYFEELKALMKKGVGRTDIPYLQVYTLIDTTAARHEDI